MIDRDPRHITPSTLHGLVEYWASLRPDATAIDGPRGRLSYRQLDRAANGLAARLRSEGVRRHDLVAVHGRPGAAAIAALLAVGKLGAAYVPLDPREPEERVAAMLAAAAPVCAISVEDEPLRTSLPLLALDDESLPSHAADPAADVEVADDDLVYVLFTSGSTGDPKGVMVEHRNVLNYVRYVARAYRLGTAVPVVPALASLSFDASVQEVLAPLARGDAVWLVRDGAKEDPAELLARLRERPGAGLHCVPSLWEEVLEVLEDDVRAHGPLALSALYLGGEIVRAELLERTLALLPDVRFANVYGPTETTVQATGGYQVQGAPGGVGTPIDDVRIAILDASQQPVPPGTPGEVWIAGAGVSRGYLADEPLTAARFLPDPDAPGARRFRSGDEGVLLPSGAIEIRGRLDEQVKVRGFRVELGEVDAALRAHPDVARAACAVLAPGSSAARVVAAVVPRRGATVDVEELTAALRRRLPEHMVPARVVCGPELPSTVRGKLDRARVVELATAPAGGGNGLPTPPLTPLAREIAEIWGEALEVGADTLAPGDDFFQLGGHSLLATRVVARVRRLTDRKIPLRSLFDHPTLDAFAATVAAHADAAQAPAEDAIAQRPAHEPVRLSFAQEALWNAEQVAPGLPAANVLLMLDLAGAVDDELVRQALARLVERHAVLRSVVALVDGRPVQLPLGADAVPLDVQDVRAQDAADRRAVGRERALDLYRAAFALAAAPPVRGVLLRRSASDAVLLLGLHHICCDGASLRVLVRDLAQLLGALASGRSAELAPAFQYRDFAAWQRERFERGALRPVVDYWVEELATPRTPPPLGRRQPPEARTYRYALAEVEAPADVLAAIERRAAAEGVTPFMALCAGLASLLRSRTGAAEVRVATLVANRARDELRDAVGLFATTIVLKLPVPPEVPDRGLTAIVRDATLRGQEHAELPLELVVEQLAARGAAGEVPFDVALVVDWERPAAAAASAAGGAGEPIALRVVEPELADLPTGVMAGACPLTIFARRHEGGLRLAAEYSCDAFARADVEVLLAELAEATRRAAG